MVRCVDCGYLARRNNETGHLDETGNTFRLRGEGAKHHQSGAQIHEGFLLCFAAAHDLYGETYGVVALKVVEAMNRERACEAFTPWRQGYTPREHQEMLDREREREWQAAQKRADREWTERQDEKAAARERQQEQERQAFQREQAKVNHLYNAIAIGVSIASLLASLCITWLTKAH